MILRCTQGHSAPFKPLVIWSKFSSSLIPRITVPGLLLPYFRLLCPQNKYMQRRQDFESTHKGLCKMSQYFILLQNQNRFEDKSSAHWASRYCEKASGNLPRWHHLDEAPLSSVHTSHHPCAHCPSADTLFSSDSSADSCQACSEFFARAEKPRL